MIDNSFFSPYLRAIFSVKHSSHWDDRRSILALRIVAESGMIVSSSTDLSSCYFHFYPIPYCAPYHGGEWWAITSVGLHLPEIICVQVEPCSGLVARTGKNIYAGFEIWNNKHLPPLRKISEAPKHHPPQHRYRQRLRVIRDSKTTVKP